MSKDLQRDLSTWAALLGLLLFTGFLIFISALVMPQVLGLVLVVVGFGGLFLLHYLLWGWWLSKVPPSYETTDDSQSNRPSSPQSIESPE